MLLLLLPAHLLPLPWWSRLSGSLARSEGPLGVGMALLRREYDVCSRWARFPSSVLAGSPCVMLSVYLFQAGWDGSAGGRELFPVGDSCFFLSSPLLLFSVLFYLLASLSPFIPCILLALYIDPPCPFCFFSPFVLYFLSFLILHSSPSRPFLPPSFFPISPLFLPPLR